MATHFSLIAWEIPWTEEPGGLQSLGLQRVRHNWGTNIFTFQNPKGQKFQGLELLLLLLLLSHFSCVQLCATP